MTLIELDDQRPEPPPRHSAGRRRIVFGAAVIVVLAVAAIVVGRAQRPAPPPHAAPKTPQNYVSSPGFTLYTSDDGDALFEIMIHSYSGNPIALSMPQVQTATGVERVRVLLTGEESAAPEPDSGRPWPPSETRMVIPAYGDATLAIGYHVGCDLRGQHGPFVIGARILAVAGPNRSFRNILPVLNPGAIYGKPYCLDR